MLNKSIYYLIFFVLLLLVIFLVLYMDKKTIYDEDYYYNPIAAYNPKDYSNQDDALEAEARLFQQVPLRSADELVDIAGQHRTFGSRHFQYPELGYPITGDNEDTSIPTKMSKQELQKEADEYIDVL